MPDFEDGMRVRVTQPAELYNDFEATKPEGELPEGTLATITVGQPYRGKVAIMTSDGVSACVPHYCLEPVDAPPSEVTSGAFLQPVRSPESLRADDIHLLLNKLVSPYLETRQNAAVALAHAYGTGLLVSFDDVRKAIVAGAVSFGPVAEALLAHSRRETIDSLLEHLKSAAVEVRAQALAEWKRLDK